MEIKSFRPSDKPYRKPDAHGMYLEIRPNGSKLWFLKYRIDGKEKRLGLGSFPEVSLADARAARDRARALVKAGRDPLHDRKMDKIERRVGAGHTFKSVADDFIQTKLVAARKAQATIEKACWYLSHLEPDIGNRPIAEIKPAELLASLKKIEKRGHHESAIRTRALASRIFRHGVATARCESDPAQLLGGALVTPMVQHRPAITTAAPLGTFPRAVDDYTGGPIVKLAMQIAPHVFLRPGELRQGRWEEIDWPGSTWTVPANRTKLRRPHAVPLSRQVFALLRELEVHSGTFSFFSFHSQSISKLPKAQAWRMARCIGWSAAAGNAASEAVRWACPLGSSFRWAIAEPFSSDRPTLLGHARYMRGAVAGWLPRRRGSRRGGRSSDYA